ncbi:prolyl oligopeptidase family serine peptidase [Myxococcota bacterium]|nr:prolyl oligopeptidase family serine peptidase [Myxococcota bacterium]
MPPSTPVCHPSAPSRVRRRLVPYDLFVFALAGGMVAACGGGDDDASPTGGSPESGDATVGTGGAGGAGGAQGPDAAPGGADTLDAGPGADASADPADAAPSPPPDAGPPPAPVQATAEWVPVSVPSWRVATVGGEDELLAFVERPGFDLPPLGRDFRGMVWSDVTPDENGGLGGFPPAIVYAAAVVPVERDTTLILRADNGITAYVDGVPQPADLYGSGRMRVPLRLKAGENVVVLRLIGGRGTPTATLWSSPDEAVFNTADVTAPDLMVGDTRPQFIGVPVLNLSGRVLRDVRAEVAGDDVFQDTALSLPALPPGGMTKLAFALQLRAAPGDAGTTRAVRLRVASPDLPFRYEQTIDLPVVDPQATHRESFLSAVDGSAQYFGLVPPSGFDPARTYGVVLTLHGAGVEGIGQAQAYAPKDWTYIAAATNRRPFGFDWEAWGRLDALEVLSHTQRVFDTDPTRVYLTGHSMGGHGTWNVGVHNPGRFAVVGPSAGWSSFYTYTGDAQPTGPFGRARAASNTNDYVTNLDRRGIYVIHGSADDNVPVREGRDMVALAQQTNDDVVYHEEPGAGHWWDGERSPGADCVDWPPLFEFMRAHTLDPFELDFDFRTPGPWVTSTHSFVTLRSCERADADCVVRSRRAPDGTVALTTENVRGLVLDGAALLAAGATALSVDDEPQALIDGPVPVGPQDGKRPDLYGPVEAVYYRPFCYVYPDDAPDYAAYAAHQLSYWAIIGNGRACALPRSLLTPRIRADFNLIHLGPEPGDLTAVPEGLTWSGGEVTLGGTTHSRASLVYVYPDGDRLSAVMTAPARGVASLFAVQPFSSRGGLPDYLVFSAGRGLAAGFFDGGWGLSAGR